MKTEWGAVSGRQIELSEHSLLKAASTQCQHTFFLHPLFLSIPIYFLTFCHFFFLCHFVTVSGAVHMLSPCISLYNFSFYLPLHLSPPLSTLPPSCFICLSPSLVLNLSLTQHQGMHAPWDVSLISMRLIRHQSAWHNTEKQLCTPTIN